MAPINLSNNEMNLKNKQQNQKGFTLIEISIILAIAGLIIIVVFVAVQGAQRSRRDAQRRSDAGRALAALEICASRNGGAYNGIIDCPARLMPDRFLDPANQVGSTANYTVITSGEPGLGELLIPGGCGGTISVAVGQESGVSYCLHN